ncbi:hypothetical protein [Vibrio parahaemolyticus]|uniref:hypothetical protein n=1 Tax=Vibrio parahaemolyticus TaxID=670 RepID=UPI00111EACE9|nr:hypothetical protein [Vibrio parahaemolyticus]EJE4695800.1 hypothetical protein [Vibrio parahaemolyticus]QLE35075.1 hypothetical protein FDV79_04590 [Vibrio parahaemolyticus]TOQ96763.1 hypothetical protein CGG84_19405 [Vibrio parahaemolyticus]
MQKFIIASAALLLFTSTANAEGFKVEFKDINTQWGTKTKLFVTSLFDSATIYKVDVNRGNCQLAWPEMPKVTFNKNKYNQSDELLKNLSNPDYKKEQEKFKPNGVVWHPYEPIDLQYGQSTGYVTTTKCRILEIVISSSEGDYRYTAD